MKDRYVGLTVVFIFMLGFMTLAVIGSEYFIEPDRYYYDGGQVVNVTLTDSRYVWDYWNGEEFKVGDTAYKVEVGDSVILYTVNDVLNIPSFYSPREWAETIHNNIIIESSEEHTPLYLLQFLYIVTFIYIGYYYMKQRDERRKTS